MASRAIEKANDNAVDHGSSVSSHDLFTASALTKMPTDDENTSGFTFGPLREPQERQLDPEDVKLTYSPDSDPSSQIQLSRWGAKNTAATAAAPRRAGLEGLRAPSGRGQK